MPPGPNWGPRGPPPPHMMGGPRGPMPMGPDGQPLRPMGPDGQPMRPMGPDGQPIGPPPSQQPPQVSSNIFIYFLEVDEIKCFKKQNCVIELMSENVT